MNQSLCLGNEAVVLVHNSQPGMTYAAEVNGQLLPYYDHGNGNLLSIFVSGDKLIAGANSIRVKVNSGCQQQFLTGSIQISGEEYLVPLVQDVSKCSPGAVSLIATGSTEGNYAWYNSEQSTTVLSTSSLFKTPVLDDTTTYYVAAINNAGCEGERIPVKAFIGDNGVGLEVMQEAQICIDNQATLTVSGGRAGAIYKWYASPESTEVLAQSDSWITPKLQNATSFYVASTDANGCESNRKEYIVSIEKYEPVFDITQRNAICFSGNTVLEISSVADMANYNWYSSESSSEKLFEGSVFVTPTLSATTEYFVEAKSQTGCVSQRQKVVTKVSVVDPTIGVKTVSAKACVGDNAIIQASGGNAVNYVWYNDANSILPIHEGEVLYTEAITHDQIFYLAGVNKDGCIGSRMEALTRVIDYTLPAIEEQSPFELKANQSEGLQWYCNGAILAGEINQILEVGKSGVYGLSVNVEGCESYTERQFIVSGIEGSIARQVAVYPNPVKDYLYLENQGLSLVHATLMDLNGAEVHALSLNPADKKSINMDKKAPGVYLLLLKTDKETIIRKVIRQ